MKKQAESAVPACGGRSNCPIANTLDLIGDKWTLLVVRDLLFTDKRLYTELLQAEEGIPSNILADRLKRLEQAQLLQKVQYQHNPVRYEYRLTPKGEDLFAVLKAMIEWGNRHLPGTNTPPPGFLQHFEEQISGRREV
jgi:DNA-binding HxlR family transcriptional regulator